jgi:hypothetical protein
MRYSSGYNIYKVYYRYYNGYKMYKMFLIIPLILDTNVRIVYPYSMTI